MENLPLPAVSAGGDEGTQGSLSDSITVFCEITSASESEAHFYLESHNYSLDSAVSTYLETAVSGADTAVDNLNPPSLLPMPTQSESDSPSQSPSASPSRSRSPSPASLRQSKYNLRSKSSGVTNSNRIRTLADLSQQSGHDHGSDSETEEPQGYYTGGEKSGMVVQDPSKANDVDTIFKQARESGGIEGTAEHLNPSSSSRNFAGTARLLSGQSVVSTDPQQPEIVTHNIVFWSNGFSVDGGPLRRLDDPENASFLESIRKSECPEELQPADRMIPVHVNLTRKEEKYPKKTRGPFKGVGRTLGSTSSNQTDDPATEVTSFTTAPTPAPDPLSGLIVDESLPLTSIQLRLADGTRMVSRFNLGHTIRDIRGFIDSTRPGGGGSRIYQLQTVGFPPKVLNDLDQSIEEAGVGNSVVIQKP